MNWKFGPMKKLWTISDNSHLKLKMPLWKMPHMKVMFTRKELGTFRRRVQKTAV